MSSPVSSRRLANLVKESLQGSVLGGVVSDAVLPAVSDDVKPGAGEDAYRVPVVVAAGSGAVVQVGGLEVARRLSPAKSQTPLRSCLSAAQPNPTWVTLSD